ncbi:hypothetical protein [Nonomuraea sediminis]|uniref:hypothetical protein n=1 Tax=Nonomuraea sediminis TaxID=2835864 RepID=UPI001BDD8624|nr:hypothetical protein [Nonomuraea sediminis]
MRATLVAGSALLTALAFGATAAPVWANPTSSATRTVAAVHAPSPQKKAPSPQKKAPSPQKKQYRKGFGQGFVEGRSDCKGKKPFDPPSSGSSPFQKGFHDGYVSGFESCK